MSDYLNAMRRYFDFNTPAPLAELERLLPQQRISDPSNKIGDCLHDHSNISRRLADPRRNAGHGTERHRQATGRQSQRRPDNIRDQRAL